MESTFRKEKERSKLGKEVELPGSHREGLNWCSREFSSKSTLQNHMSWNWGGSGGSGLYILIVTVKQ